MNRAETALLLGKVAAVDNRRLDPDDADVSNPMATPIISAWHELLSDLRFSDCLAAVQAHRRASKDWIYPVHVIEGVRRIREARLDAAPPERELMAGVDPRVPGPEWVRIYRERRRRVADGATDLRAITGGRA